MKFFSLYSLLFFALVMQPVFAGRYYDSATGRWLSVDPMANKYPGWSPYNYTLCNPMRFIDTNGMWTAEYDKDKNIVSVKYEKGDTYENLYTQLGISAEQFSKQFGVDVSKTITANATFDITNFSMENTNFDGNSDGSNCHGFTIFAKGKSSNESNTPGNELLNALNNPNPTSNPTTGDVAVWTTQGSVDGQDLTGDPAHSAIFIVNNQAGESQFINRLGTNHPVSIGTNSQITGYYSQQIQEVQSKFNVVLPTMSPAPVFYGVK